MNAAHRSITLCGLLTAAVLVGGASDLRAADAKNTTAVQMLMTQELEEFPGKEAVMLTVEYLPGGASQAHRHDAHVFVYVLEGSIVMQVDGGREVTLGRGQTFHEGPHDVHRKSANASATVPAKFLVFMLKDRGRPVSLPVPAGG